MMCQRSGPDRGEQDAEVEQMNRPWRARHGPAMARRIRWGGRIIIKGNAGHLVGSASRGSPAGLQGGEIVVFGNAGNEVGGGMRRGLIAIGGNTGDFTGVNMLAGTVVVLGQLGARTGAGMKRGSIVSMHPAEMLPTFTYACSYRPVFLRLYLAHLRTSRPAPQRRGDGRQLPALVRGCRRAEPGRSPAARTVTNREHRVSTLCLTLREPPAQRVDLSPLTAGQLMGRALEHVAALELATGNRKVRLDSLFAVTGTFASELEIHGSCDRLDGIGAGMTHGRIIVEGDTGAFLGAGMTGGSIVVRGNVGAYAATAMQGGRIHVYGSTGDFLAAARPGERHGMRGGLVLVDGDTGDRLGDRMRRGMVLIEGNAGDYCASRMVAGTIAVWGSVGTMPGLGMRRGTLLLQRTPSALPPTFNDCGVYPLNFLTLLVRSWRTLRSKYSNLPDSGLRVRRYMGDVANDGRGEILVMA